MDTIYSMHNISYQQVVQLETIIRTIILSPVHAQTSFYQKFFIQELWNQLPADIVEANNLLYNHFHYILWYCLTY